MEGVCHVERDATAVVGLIFDNLDAVSIHAPVVVARVENVGRLQFYCKGFVEECLANAHIHYEPRCTEPVGVHVATALSVDIGGDSESSWNRQSVLHSVEELWFIVIHAIDC